VLHSIQDVKKGDNTKDFLSVHFPACGGEMMVAGRVQLLRGTADIDYDCMQLGS
jgi:hypothetical protein